MLGKRKKRDRGVKSGVKETAESFEKHVRAIAGELSIELNQPIRAYKVYEEEYPSYMSTVIEFRIGQDKWAKFSLYRKSYSKYKNNSKYFDEVSLDVDAPGFYHDEMSSFCDHYYNTKIWMGEALDDLHRKFVIGVIPFNIK